MKLYIAGKITGDPAYMTKFDEAQWLLTKAGHTVFNPARQPEGLTRSEYMRLAMNDIDIADAVVFLPDWRESGGAQVERAYCQYIEKPCKEIAEFVGTEQIAKVCKNCAALDDGYCYMPLGSMMGAVAVEPEADFCSAWKPKRDDAQ